VTIPPDAAWRITDQIGHAYSVFLGLAAASLAHLDITVGEFVALTILTASPDGLTQTTWGELQGVTRQRAHTVTKRLANLGLVAVVREGRASTVTVTDAGWDLIQREQPRLAGQAAANLGSLTPTEAARLSTLLAKLLDGHPRGSDGLSPDALRPSQPQGAR
jgi:DNA-binding MarR family transcriptional regulator